jgi:16S rRNA (guanine527-N7)-methyltransferase
VDFFDELERELRDGLARVAAVAAAPDEAAIGRMLVHARTLHKWNSTHNLTSVKTPRDYAEALFVDSWLVTGLVDAFDGTLVDVGSGGGFPALVVLAAHPELPAVLFEKVEKKRSFLSAAIVALGLKHATVAREPFPPQKGPLPASPRIFTSRATWAPHEWLTIARATAQPGDAIIVQASQEALPDGAARTLETALPFSQAKRRLGRY